MQILELNSGDTAWILTSAALVLLMTPGLALFYGGMVRAKSVLNMMMMSFGALALVSILWVLYGYSFAFGNDIGFGRRPLRRDRAETRPSHPLQNCDLRATARSRRATSGDESSV